MAFRAIAFSTLCTLLLSSGFDAASTPSTPVPADRPVLGNVTVTTLTANAPAPGAPEAKNAASAIVRPQGLVYDKTREALWVGGFANLSVSVLYHVDPTTGVETKVVQDSPTTALGSMLRPNNLEVVREGSRRGDVVVSSRVTGWPIRIIDVNNGATGGNVTTLAGGSRAASYGEGKGSGAYLRGVSDVTTLPGRPGEVFFTDSGNHCVRKVNIHTTQTARVFGRCTVRGYTEGHADAALLNTPWGITSGAERDTFYFSDRVNNIVRMVNLTSGAGSTLVGRRNVTDSQDGYAGDEDESASIYRPTGMSRAGDVLFIVSHMRLSAFILSKKYLHLIVTRDSGFRDVSAAGATVLLADSMLFIAAASETTIFFSDSGNRAVRRIDVVWTQGVVAVPDVVPPPSPFSPVSASDSASGTAALCSAAAALLCAAMSVV